MCRASRSVTTISNRVPTRSSDDSATSVTLTLGSVMLRSWTASSSRL